MTREYPVSASITPGVTQESSGYEGGATEESGVIEESGATEETSPEPDQATKSHIRKSFVKHTKKRK